MPIQLLRDDVASQIAAGEVVERPASVVKELLENALDAGASSVRIFVKQAGRKLIEVSDDGQGIPSGELALATARHATSKLQSAGDLQRIHTLGFRGEALASIGSVSRMALTSRPAAQPKGARVFVDGGAVGEVQSVAAPAGTSVRVEDLFQNLPARLKFLKTDVTEWRAIEGFVARYAVAYPQVRFSLVHDGREVIQTSGNGNPREALVGLLPATLARQMLEVNYTQGETAVRGFVSPTSETRGNRAGMTFFVNGRWVQDASLTSALLRAYHTMIMVGRYPSAVLFIELPPDQVDVNVHPAKAEVRFQDAQEVFSLVQRSVKQALLAYTPVHGLGGGITVQWGTEQEGIPNQDAFRGAGSGEWSGQAIKSRGLGLPITPEHATAGAQQLHSGIPLLRWVGQIGNTFIVAEGPDGLYLVDQHAAHERVLFERIMRQRNEEIPAQTLLEPAVIQVSTNEERLLEEQLPILARLGFEVEVFGPGMYRVLAYPASLLGLNPEQALRVLLEDFEEDETPLQAEVEARIIARVCKRAAVKGGQALSEQEQRALIRDLEGCNSPRTCPHGRPTMIHISLDLLERQFGRRGAL